MKPVDHMFILKALGSQLSECFDPAPFYRSLSTDSRTTQPGDLFLAVKGEDTDGHPYIEKALAAGATGIMLSDSSFLPSSHATAIYQVADTLTAFRLLTMKWRERFTIPVVGIAGSVGKTTVKDMTAAFLSGRYAVVLKTEQSQNGFLGIPLTLAKMDTSTEAAVIEIGIDAPHAMAQHMALVKPDVTILTAIGPEHLEGLGNLETVIEEESLSLSMTVAQDGWAIVNFDDPYIAPLGKKLPVDNLWAFGFHTERLPQSPEMATRSISAKLNDQGTTLTLQGGNLDGLTVPLLMPGRHNALNQLGAITICACLGLNRDEIIRGAQNFKASPGRSHREDLQGITLIRDYYNANPTSMVAAFAMLADAVDQRKGAHGIVCLGDMLELGTDEESFHRQLAMEIKKQPIQTVFCLGERMKWLIDELKKIGFTGESSWFFDHATMGNALKTRAKTGDVVLIKGSRGMKMERVFDTFFTKESGI